MSRDDLLYKTGFSYAILKDYRKDVEEEYNKIIKRIKAGGKVNSWEYAKIEAKKELLEKLLEVKE